MTSLSDIHSMIHAAFHDWHWHKQQYLMASSTVMSCSAICFSLRSSKKAAQIAIRSQILSICDKFRGEILSNSPSLGSFGTSTIKSEGEVFSFYSKMVTLVQIIDGSGLDRKNMRSIKEFFWLQLADNFWGEMAGGSRYSFIMSKCRDEHLKQALSGQRRTTCISFKKIIKKHKGKEFPKNVPPKIKKK